MTPFEEIVIDKLNNLEERVNKTCNTLSEVKTTQYLFIKQHEEEVTSQKQKQDRKFDKKIAVVALAVALFEAVQFLNGSF